MNYQDRKGGVLLLVQSIVCKNVEHFLNSQMIDIGFLNNCKQLRGCFYRNHFQDLTHRAAYL